jgi:hypothetical protein
LSGLIKSYNTCKFKKFATCWAGCFRNILVDPKVEGVVESEHLFQALFAELMTASRDARVESLDVVVWQQAFLADVSFRRSSSGRT